MSYKEAWKIAWSKATKEQKDWYKSLPNFDAAIFKEITGIDIEDNGKKEKLIKKAEELKAKADGLLKQAEEM